MKNSNSPLPAFLFFFILNLLLTSLSISFAQSSSQKPEIQLANLYHKNIEIKNYLVSEKLDGVRAYWDGEKLISREGNIYNAPKWFIADFPKEHLEGELWIGRGKFEELSGIVRTEIPDDEGWKMVRLMLFDMPKHEGVFTKRLEAMKNLVANSGSKYLKVIEQSKISTHQNLTKQLNEVVKNGGEGLMLHRDDSLYQAVRNDDLLKLKTFEDAEAVVIAHIAGEGKFTGMMGAMLVENKEKSALKLALALPTHKENSHQKLALLLLINFLEKLKIISHYLLVL